VKTLKCLAVLIILCNPLVMFAQTKSVAAASPEALCSFITGRMTSSLPQVPTLCSGKQHLPGYLDINIFAAKDVFQTNMRRTWSSALFQTLQALSEEKSMKGACFEAPKCIFSISDGTMAERRLRYRLILDQNMMSVLRSRGADYSDPWYVSWWTSLMGGKEADYPQSKENAESLGKDACDVYKKQSEMWSRAFNKPIPSCSVMLATNKALVLVIDYDDFLSAWDESNVKIALDAIGQSMDNMAYKGNVIIRSPWNKRDDGRQSRIYNIYDLGGLEFAYEEVHSGTRSETSGEIILTDYFLSIGQTESDKVTTDTSSQYILRESRVQDGTILIDATDGSEWRATSDSLTRCPLAIGDETFLFNDGNKSMLFDQATISCQANVIFVKGW